MTTTVTKRIIAEIRDNWSSPITVEHLHTDPKYAVRLTIGEKATLLTPPQAIVLARLLTEEPS